MDISSDCDILKNLIKLTKLNILEKVWIAESGAIIAIFKPVGIEDRYIRYINIINKPNLFLQTSFLHPKEGKIYKSITFEEWLDGINSSMRKKLLFNLDLWTESLHLSSQALEEVNNTESLGSKFVWDTWIGIEK